MLLGRQTVNQRVSCFQNSGWLIVLLRVLRVFEDFDGTEFMKNKTNYAIDYMPVIRQPRATWRGQILEEGQMGPSKNSKYCNLV